MPYFDNDGIKIYYEIEGEGPPVVMIHGFAGNSEGIRKQTNWVEALKDNYRLILLDCRGHGKSDKPYDGSYYGKKMTDDVIKLLEHLSIEKANFFGYSMGASIAFHLLLTKSEIIISAILGGFIITLNEKEISKDREDTKQVIEAFKAESIDQVKDPMVRAFRQFAELRKNDLLALAAVQAGWLNDSSEIMPSPAQMEGALKKIKVPVMSVVGSSDDSQPGEKTLLARLIPDACHFQIQGKDHLAMITAPKFQMVVKAFLDFVNNQ